MSNILERRLYVSSLNSIQSSFDASLESVSRQASDPFSLLAMTAGSFAFQLTRLGVFKLGSSFASSGLLPHIFTQLSSQALGLFSEVAAFRSVNKQFDLWRGKETQDVFDAKGGWGTVLDFGILKYFAPLASKSLILGQFVQANAVILGHQLSAKLHLVEEEQGTYLEKLVKVQVTNMAMSAGQSLFHFMTGNKVLLQEKVLSLRGEVLSYSNLYNIFHVNKCMLAFSSERDSVVAIDHHALDFLAALKRQRVKTRLAEVLRGPSSYVFALGERTYVYLDTLSGELLCNAEVLELLPPGVLRLEIEEGRIVLTSSQRDEFQAMLADPATSFVERAALQSLLEMAPENLPGMRRAQSSHPLVEPLVMERLRILRRDLYKLLSDQELFFEYTRILRELPSSSPEATEELESLANCYRELVDKPMLLGFGDENAPPSGKENIQSHDLLNLFLQNLRHLLIDLPAGHRVVYDFAKTLRDLAFPRGESSIAGRSFLAPRVRELEERIYLLLSEKFQPGDSEYPDAAGYFVYLNSPAAWKREYDLLNRELVSYDAIHPDKLEVSEREREIRDNPRYWQAEARRMTLVVKMNEAILSANEEVIRSMAVYYPGIWDRVTRVGGCFALSVYVDAQTGLIRQVRGSEEDDLPAPSLSRIGVMVGESDEGMKIINTHISGSRTKLLWYVTLGIIQKPYVEYSPAAKGKLGSAKPVVADVSANFAGGLLTLLRKIKERF